MRRPKLEILNPEDIQQIIAAAYDLLDDFGVMVDNAEALQILAEGGARVDFENKIARISAELINKALETKPSAFAIYDQEGQQPALLEGDRAHFCPGSVALNILDSETQKIRPPGLEDLIKIVSLAQSLENVQFVTGPIVPADIPKPLLDAYRYYLIMLNTTKPLFAGAFTVDGLRVQLEMFSVLCGGEDEFRARPRAVFAANPTAPLRWGGVVTQNLMDCARFGVPVMLIPMPLPGGNAPVTLAGTLAEHTAETLSGTVIAQLINPGTPILYGGGAILLDMRYGTSCIGSVESHLLGSGYALIGKTLGFPTASNIGQSDAKRVDTQAGLESGMGILVAALSGINLSRGPGMMAFANCQSFEKLVIDNEICGMAQRFIRGVECSRETIALDVIKAAGRDAKGYLTSSHTLEWFRKELVFPGKIIHRWAADGKEKEPGAWDRARVEVKARLDNFVPALLPEEKVREIKRIMTSYAKSKGVDSLPELNGSWIG